MRLKYNTMYEIIFGIDQNFYAMVSQIQAVKYTLKSPTRTEIQTTNTSTAMQTKVTFQLNKCHFRMRQLFILINCDLCISFLFSV